VQWFRDIIDRIDRIEAILTDDAERRLREEPNHLAAVSYFFIVIGEAATRLRGTAERLLPDVDWQAIRGFGNMLKHQYDRNDVAFIADVVSDGTLRRLREACELGIQKIVHKKG
jgi:uncharacterized protein with HEPN domain